MKGDDTNMISIGMTGITMILLAPLVVLMVLGIRAGGKRRIAAIVIPCVIVTVIFLAGFFSFLMKYNSHNRVIGTFSGAEYDYITIDGETYEIEMNSKYSYADVDELLGKVEFDGNTPYRDPEPMYVWSIKGSDDHIYGRAADGSVYKKVE